MTRRALEVVRVVLDDRLLWTCFALSAVAELVLGNSFAVAVGYGVVSAAGYVVLFRGFVRWVSGSWLGTHDDAEEGGA